MAELSELPERLDPLSFPLSGSRLIEASAGTGKTYTIATLYVRLVLGHGGPTGFGRCLIPPEILVVTFTEAATKELRDRIRIRLFEAAQIFREASGANLILADSQLLELRGSFPEATWPGCARRLELASEWMDDAAISTIHAWCQRMLREHAFDSGSLFTQELIADKDQLLMETVRDYWRTFMTPLTVVEARSIGAFFKDPLSLFHRLKGLIDQAHQLEGKDPPSVVIERTETGRLKILSLMKQAWSPWIEEVRGLLKMAVDNKWVNGQKLQARYFDEWLDKLKDWTNDETLIWPLLKLDAKVWTRLTPSGLEEAFDKGISAPQHPLFEAMETFKEDLESIPNALPELLGHAALWVRNTMDKEQIRRSQMGFNDLLTRLDAALQGANGDHLAAIIRQQFPVALIDEFQDTDPIQYRIFDRVYNTLDQTTPKAMILIGDPKQAIYGFRGGDLHTYLKARKDCASAIYSLQRNYRSTTAMVEATNHLFLMAESRPIGRGAFLFRSPSANRVPFYPAEAQDRQEQLLINSAPKKPLSIWSVPEQDDLKPWGSGLFRSAMARACAIEIVALLNLSKTGALVFQSLEKGREIVPRDLAILVSNRTEAGLIRRELADRGVRSVYLSDQDSVFQSAHVSEIEAWLRACAEPDDARLLRAALATPLLGFSYQELGRLQQDEKALEERMLQFRDYHTRWQRQGVLPMLRRLLHDFNVPHRLLKAPSFFAKGARQGERSLTDVLHLAELLQEASLKLDGEQALIRFLQDQRTSIDRAGIRREAQQVRLESDENLVQVVTIHKSKGLEYDLVFIPFIALIHKPKSTVGSLYRWHNDQGDLCVTLTPDNTTKLRVQQEQLAEDLRKLYVAMTRARYATWLGFGPVENVEQSALGYLLTGGEAIPKGTFNERLNALQLGAPDHIALIPSQGLDDQRWSEHEAHQSPLRARTSTRCFRENWWIASYSSLKKRSSAEGECPLWTPAPETPDADHYGSALLEEPPEASSNEIIPWPSILDTGSVHTFPTGAQAGTFLHDLLEWIANQGFQRILQQPTLLREEIIRKSVIHGYGDAVDLLEDWLHHLLKMPLSAGILEHTIALQNLSIYQAEMEFWMTVRAAPILKIDDLICRATLQGLKRPALEAGTLNGMLKGFIDLVFLYEDRYYVLDYKSNRLGTDSLAYTPDKLQRVMLEARYDLQYVLYLLALHRHLKSRKSDYDYDRHMGGAIYLFLRGGHAESRGIYADRPPRLLIEHLDRLFDGPERGALS